MANSNVISVRLNEKEEELFRGYANVHGMALSEAFKKALAEKIEDEHDLKVYEEAIKEFEADPVTYTMDEVGKELGLL